MLYGYRVGQSPAGRRIEAAGIAYQRRVEREAAAPDHNRIEAIQAALDAAVPPDSPIADIISAVARQYGLTYRDIIGQSRVPKLSRARQEAYYRCAAETGATTTVIGRAFGGRDHTTIIYGIRRHCERAGAPLPRGMSGYAYVSPRQRERERETA